MKKTIYLLLLLSLIMSMTMMTSCITTRSSSQINKVEVGMTKKEITALLGTPIFKNGDTGGEQWGYQKMIGEITGPEQVLFLVSFDTAGKVVAYETIKEHPHHLH